MKVLELRWTVVNLALMALTINVCVKNVVSTNIYYYQGLTISGETLCTGLESHLNS